jgi:hypothetical protein
MDLDQANSTASCFIEQKSEHLIGRMQEAEKALSLDKLLVIDRQLRVELAQTALDSKGQSGGTQYAALQMEQIQQLQRSQLEQHSLAAQVASMRVQAKQHPGALNPGELGLSTLPPSARTGPTYPEIFGLPFCNQLHACFLSSPLWPLGVQAAWSEKPVTT